MNAKAKNVKSALSNPRTRTIFMLSAGIVVAIIAVLGMILSRSGKSSDPSLTSQVSTPPEVQGNYAEAGATTAEYDELLAKRNQEDAQQALDSGTSSIPVPRGDVEQSVMVPTGEPGTPGPGAPTDPMPVPTAPVNPGDDRAYEDAHSQNEDAIAKRQTAMRAQADRLQAYWQYQAHTQTLIAPPRGEGGAGTTNATNNANATQYQAAIDAADASRNDIHAGDQLYATLDTAINSDETGPVIATVRQPGPFQGARLIGQISMGQDAKAVGVQFSTMSVPGEAESRAINAWAVDPHKDNRAALATDVNNHYLSNGAKVFIGAFLAGYSDGLLKGGQNENVITSGINTVVQKDAYTDRQLMQIGVGNVGRTVSQNVSQGSTRKRTVKVDAGIDIGVLFLQDAAPNR